MDSSHLRAFREFGSLCYSCPNCGSAGYCEHKEQNFTTQPRADYKVPEELEYSGAHIAIPGVSALDIVKMKYNK